MERNKLLIGLLIVASMFIYNMAQGPAVKTEIDRKTVVETKIVEKVVKPDGEVIHRETVSLTKDNLRVREIKQPPKNWSFGVSSSVLERTPVYGVSLDGRLIGNFWIGGYYRTDHEKGLYIRFSF